MHQEGKWMQIFYSFLSLDFHCALNNGKLNLLATTL